MTKSKYIKLGAFVLAGIIFLILALYSIGANRNLFKSTFTLHTTFRDVGGLRTGNSVRFAGIDIGTVSNIYLLNDTTVNVSLAIVTKYKDFLKTDIIASIGTDGIMGNRLVILNAQPGPAPQVEDGSSIQSSPPLDTDEMLRTFQQTNENIAILSNDLREISQRIINNHSLMALLQDTLLPLSVKSTLESIGRSGRNFEAVSGRTLALINKINEGRGLAGSVLADTAIENHFKLAVADLQSASSEARKATEQLYEVLTKVQRGEGAAGSLLSDPATEEKFNQIMINIEKGTHRFSENMEALQHNFLFRGYFRRQERRRKD